MVTEWNKQIKQNLLIYSGMCEVQKIQLSMHVKLANINNRSIIIARPASSLHDHSPQSAFVPNCVSLRLCQ